MSDSAVPSRSPALLLASLLASVALAPISRAAGDARACTLPLPELYARVSPAVVSITSAAIRPNDVDHQIDRRSGSGMILDPAGLVLTNAHVVYGRPLVTVTLDDGTTLPAKVAGADPVFDIALLSITPPPGPPLPSVRLGDSDALRVGDEVYAIGNPFGLEQTLTRGIVSAVNRVLPGATWSLKEPLIQTDAAINPGNSGGPLVDRCGDVVGLTTAILPEAQSIGFAVPSSLVAAAAPELLRNGRAIRPWLGVQGALVSPALRDLLRAPLPEGLLVEVVEPGSPAARAGVKGGDLDLVIAGEPLLVGGEVITAIDGKPVGTADALTGALGRLRVGGRAVLTLFREGRTRTVDLPVVERPAPSVDEAGSPLDAPVAGVSRPARAGRFVPGGALVF